MSKDRVVLGLDCNGKPLRVGDQVAPRVGARLHDEAPPAPWTILDRSGFPGMVILSERDLDGDIWSCRMTALRRIDDRHAQQPGEYTFDSLMDHLKSGVPA